MFRRNATRSMSKIHRLPSRIEEEDPTMELEDVTPTQTTVVFTSPHPATVAGAGAAAATADDDSTNSTNRP